MGPCWYLTLDYQGGPGWADCQVNTNFAFVCLSGISPFVLLCPKKHPRLESFMIFCLSQTDNNAGSKISNALKNDSL